LGNVFGKIFGNPQPIDFTGFVGIFMAFIFPKKKLPKTGFYDITISKDNSLYPPKDKIEYSLFPFPPLFFL
jgi:hypothetical protein